MSEEASSEDPWAWLHSRHLQDEPDYSAFSVVAGVLPERGEPFTGACRAAVADQTAIVDEIRDDLPPDVPGDWIWVVPDTAQPDPAALAALLDRVLAEPDAAVLGALLIEPRRRGAGTLVSDWAQTISGSGRVRPLTEPGELYQGQLSSIPALGVPAAGMLVRGDAWRFLGGLNSELPPGSRGLDFGWRANLAGYSVVAEPKAQLVDNSLPDDPIHDRAAGLALIAGHSGAATRWLTSLRLILVTLLASLGYLLGKDPQRAGEEIRGLGRWLGNPRLRHSITDQLGSLPITPATRTRTRALLPARWSWVRRSAELIAARLSEWAQTFTGRGAAVSLDEMTGDDFAQTGTTRYRVPVAVTGSALLLIGALVAARGSFGAGSLTATQLLAAPDSWLRWLGDYLAPIPGTGAIAAAPWTALAAIGSLITAGRPEWLVTLTFVLVVPLAWLMAFRLLRQLVADRRLAAVGAVAYALAPALLGGLNAGAFGLAITSVLLPILGYSCWAWLAGRELSWRRAGAVANWLTLICALVPLFWLAALFTAAVTALRARSARAWAQWALVLAAPGLLLLGPWGGTLARYPGRLLTGIEPVLAPTDAPEPWALLVGHPLDAAAPLWLSLGFFGICWLAAFAGAARRPGIARWAFVGAGTAAAVAIGLTRWVVQVPPDAAVRPQALEWQLAAVAGLVLAAVAGLDGILVELQGRDLGLRHVSILGLAVLCVAAIVVGAGWWVLAGQLGPTRGPVGEVPAFVRNAQRSPTPGRTLALTSSGGEVSWSLLEDDFARLGEGETGAAFGGDAAASRLAGSVAARVIGDTADDQILPDLVSLGVAHVALAGGDSELRMAINNVPGLGLGTGDPTQFVWPVPDSATAVLVTDDGRTPVGTGTVLPAGPEDRVLRLAEPPDPRWDVRVGDTRLAQVAGQGPGTAFLVGAGTGELNLALDGGSSWWAWAQLAGFVVLAVLAAPSVRRRGEATGPKRLTGGAR